MVMGRVERAIAPLCRSFGYSQIDGNDKQPLTAETKYRIHSITKPYTAVMIFQLVAEGKLKLTDTLDQCVAVVDELESAGLECPALNGFGHRHPCRFVVRRGALLTDVRSIGNGLSSLSADLSSVRQPLAS